MKYDSGIQRIDAVSSLPPNSLVHITGICGTGMSAVASLFKQLGHRVVGSDKAFYPPMGDFVKEVADRLFNSYSESNFSTRPDLVVIGNSIRAENPEATYALREGLPYASMPEVFAALLIGRRSDCPTSVVISGTHGKTTTSAAAAWLLECSGVSPGYFIGGISENFSTNIRTVSPKTPLKDRAVVMEGDEYDSAFFLKQPKFLSYRPDILVITSVEFDHADIYESLDEIDTEFAKLVALVPQEGLILIADSDPRLHHLASTWKKAGLIQAECCYYGEEHTSNYRLLKREPLSNGEQRLLLDLKDKQIMATTRLSGRHNAYNLLVAAAIADRQRLSADSIISGISSFAGVRRRQTILSKPSSERNSPVVIEDFAHHPTAVHTTLSGIKESYPSKRVIAVFEPRSNTSRRNFFQKEYADSFEFADLVIIKTVVNPGDYSKSGAKITALDVDKLTADLRSKGKSAISFPDTTNILKHLTDTATTDDVVVFMSNGDFENIQHQYVANICPKHAA